MIAGMCVTHKLKIQAKAYTQKRKQIKTINKHNTFYDQTHLSPIQMYFCNIDVKVKSMQRPGTEAIKTQIQPSKPKREINKITNRYNTKRIYGQPSEQLFSKR